MIRALTARNVMKVTRYRKDGEAQLESMVRRMETKKGLKSEKGKEVRAGQD